jgi:hydroxymethylpyrimidine pyrophosphatase-like HAD family hydrolase
MSEKVIIILDGQPLGKTGFINTIKSNGYWVWNINPKNVIAALTYRVGWDSTKNEKWYDFLENFSHLANKYFDFDNWYFNEMIDKFLKNEKVQVLILHNVSEDLFSKLQEDYTNCFSVLTIDSDIVDDNYSKTLNYLAEDYDNQILNVMNILTKSL